MPKIMILPSGPLSLETAEALLAPDVVLNLAPESWEAVLRCRAFLDERNHPEAPAMYGINTGFGALCHTRVSAEALGELQENLVKSHACGTGEAISPDLVRAMLLLKIKSLSHGYSGVSKETLQYLLHFYNVGATPVIYEAGSLGASGDLAPLAHMSLPLLGLGEIDWQGKRWTGAEFLAHHQLPPLSLKSKEGLALLNGTQFMGGLSLVILSRGKKLLDWAHLISALSLEAYDGLLEPFHPAIGRLRAHGGQVEVARIMRQLLEKSPGQQKPKSWVQDPYSFRCIPQVHGASADALQYAMQVLETEMSSVTDNPLVIPEENLVLSGGNFHGQPLALMLDFLAIALAELGSMSERRIYRLVDGQRGLPPFLTPTAGLHSGFMILQYAAASLVNRNKQRCMPHSVDTIDSSRGQEDHVSMGANAAVKTWAVLQDAERLLAMELLTASQAFSFRRPQVTSPALESLLAAFQKDHPFLTHDVVMQPLMSSALAFIQLQHPKTWLP